MKKFISLLLISLLILAQPQTLAHNTNQNNNLYNNIMKIFCFGLII